MKISETILTISIHFTIKKRRKIEIIIEFESEKEKSNHLFINIPLISINKFLIF